MSIIKNFIQIQFRVCRYASMHAPNEVIVPLFNRLVHTEMNFLKNFTRKFYRVSGFGIENPELNLVSNPQSKLHNFKGFSIAIPGF